jgi:phenylalanyl-tRNA synthetase beta chain
LDEKERKLSNEDLMICNDQKGMCIAGVFGGSESGVTENTTAIFLESAFFDPISIRKTSFRHGLRTDAATRFEKGIDISNTVTVLKRAAQLIKEITGGEIASDIIDQYPKPETKKEVVLKYQYLKKLSGKNYHPDTVKHILQSLGFAVLREGGDAMMLEVPHHKRDVSLPADVVEEILRIDGLDNIDIPTAITITPAVEVNYKREGFKEKIANSLVGSGFSEILTNSITNSAYFSEDQAATMVKLLNNLSSELDVLRPAILPTALEVIAFNHNRKNTDLRLFEFGKTYKKTDTEKYSENNHLCLYITGNIQTQQWKGKSTPADIYYLKGVAEAILQIAGIKASYDTEASSTFMESYMTMSINGTKLLKLGKVAPKVAARFDIKQPVYFANFNWDLLLDHALKNSIQFRETAKFPAVERDLAMVVSKNLPYRSVQDLITKLRLNKLQDVRLFDVFESEKLGADKKSLAVNFTFLDEEKTLTDKEIDGWMTKIMTSLEKELGAEIRK